MLEAAEVQVVGDDVEQLRRLAEDEHFVTRLLQPYQHLIEDHELAANVDDFLRRILHLGPRMFDEKRVVDHTTKQHHDVAHLR